jgi:sensor histidine kinase YesM
MTVDPSIAAEAIPSLILQPLVENAIKHGLAPKLDGGTLRIRAGDENGFVGLVVEDDGVGWVEDRQSEESANRFIGAQQQNHPRARFNHLTDRRGIGLQNVAERLRTLYGDRAEMTIQSAAGRGTRISILIPKNRTGNAIAGETARLR